MKAYIVFLYFFVMEGSLFGFIASMFYVLFELVESIWWFIFFKTMLYVIAYGH